MKPTMLRIRKLADTSDGERVVRYDPETGARKLVNPATPGDDHEPWPAAGVQIEGDTPKATRVSTTFVEQAVSEGWIELKGERLERATGGPPHDPTRIIHRFICADTLVMHTVDGDLRYTITHNPGKYDDADEPSGKRVDWFYDLKLEA